MNLENDYYRVKLQLCQVISEATCWYEIMIATDALCHTRLLYKPMKEESDRARQQESLGQQAKNE